MSYVCCGLTSFCVVSDCVDNNNIGGERGGVPADHEEDESLLNCRLQIGLWDLLVH